MQLRARADSSDHQTPTGPSGQPSPTPSTATEPREPATKKRALRRENWEAHRATIKRLYIDEDRKLNDIVEIMKRDYDFAANARMYKHRLSQWGLIKYNRESDVQLILQLKNKRDAEGKGSHIEINGRVVDFDRVQRYLQRRKISVDDFAEENFATWGNRNSSCSSNKSNGGGGGDDDDEGQDHSGRGAIITIRTPTPESAETAPSASASTLTSSAPRSPAMVQFAEEVVWDAGACASEAATDNIGRVDQQPSPLGFALINSVTMISELMQQQRPGPAGEYMHLASKQAEDLIRSRPHETVVWLYEATLILAHSAPEVAALLLRHAADIALVFMAEAHPMQHLLRKLAEIAGTNDVQALVETTRRAFRCHIATWDRVRGLESLQSMYWWCWIRYLRAVGPDDMLDSWVYCSDSVVRAAEEREQQEREAGVATSLPSRLGPETDPVPGLTAGVPLEPYVLLGRYEMANTLSAERTYRDLERVFAALIQRSRELGAVFSQAFHELAMAAVARQANRRPEADEYGRAALASYVAAGRLDTAARIGAWMQRWDEDFDSTVYKFHLMTRAFGDGLG